MLVKDIMSRHVRTVTPDTPMREVVSAMTLYRVSGLPVIEEERLVGFIAEKDVLHHLFPSLEEAMTQRGTFDFEDMESNYAQVVNLKVSDLMSTGVIGVTQDMPVLKATSLMVRHRFRRIPVVDGDKLLGMMSLGDVHKAIFKKNIADVCAKV
ncbi:MAG: CBS domain-containing protein [Gammaproteobacteria bacterium]|jgi:CBS domain-containing protein|nr:CBS domain-containing protein [Gammaproteobacteria bacterium]MBT3489119.1 CBS domain-containing protein [Gammaproteobacteria bacterium]MBT3718896.1 CBS domain-containing protein [Gammaproteobacteria bacterium]MBT3845211.1 CBS domain-containing protein [Gammaproteobacteria bacterium]MBT3892233.1 CBS domain-containing protein [Gammaproteobacteria bacterium]